MSHVSNVVLHIDDPEEALKDELEANGLVRMQERGWGGSKYFEDDVYLAAFNYLDVPAFIRWFRVLPWSNQSAALSIDTEGEEWQVSWVRDGIVRHSERVERRTE